MMRISETLDADAIKRIVTDPAVYPMVTEDDSPSIEEYEPPMADCVTYLLVEDDGMQGVFALIKKSSAVVELHTCLLPCCRGKRALEAVKLMIDHVWANTKFTRIVTAVAEFNKPAILFALKSGFERYGLNPKSYVKHDALWDTVMLGLTRPEETVGSCRS